MLVQYYARCIVNITMKQLSKVLILVARLAQSTGLVGMIRVGWVRDQIDILNERSDPDYSPDYTIERRCGEVVFDALNAADKERLSIALLHAVLKNGESEVIDYILTHMILSSYQCT